MSKSVLIGLAAMLAAACSSAPEGASGPDASLRQAPGGPAESGFVTGSVVLGGDPVRTTYEFHGRIMPDGAVDGTFQVRRHLGPEGGAKVHGRIACLVIEGNQAWLGGVIEHAINPDNIGKGYGFNLIDNGEGTGAAPDQIGRQFLFPSAEQWCAERPEVVIYDVAAGNIQIHAR